jgi:hypothetical protein
MRIFHNKRVSAQVLVSNIIEEAELWLKHCQGKMLVIVVALIFVVVHVLALVT